MEPRRLVTRFYDEVWNRPDPSIIPQLFHEDCVFRGSLGVERHGHAGLAAYVGEVTGALADYLGGQHALFALEDCVEMIGRGVVCAVFGEDDRA